MKWTEVGVGKIINYLKLSSQAIMILPRFPAIFVLF